MSINQNANTGALPNFRNLGILLRILVIVDGMCLAAALLKTTEALALMEELIEVSSLVQPILILSLLTLAAGNDWLHRLRYWHATAAVIALELALTIAVSSYGGQLFGAGGGLVRNAVFCLLITGILIGYFDLRGRALSPALAEARLQALQARIRPHFLFNSINAVLSLMRQEPRRAEQALEDLADLFRVLMADNRQLAPIAQEVALAKQYLSIEELRLGDRLRVEWDTEQMPADALIPPLVLQPLLENAVYHGIEPRSEPGTISILIRRAAEQMHLTLRNPYRADGAHHAGNRMALANIRERLALHFDAEAGIKTVASTDSYEVRIVIPYLKARA
ncbi:MAG: two-component system sensor ATPase [Betaproteobacteria bacterium]|nr:two-component system sensor ATPase [Betaproteobacteria bacterium]